MNAGRPDHSLDTRGSFCPVPIVETDAALRGLPVGAVLEILADDPGIKLDLPAWCKANGQRLLSIEKEGRVFRALVEKAGERT